MGFNSNEVKDLSKEPLYLKDGNRDLKIRGLWADIKEALPKGARYTSSIYALVDGRAIKHQAKRGATLNTWIDTLKDVNVEEVGIMLTGNEERKNGATTYYVPTLDIFTPTEAENQQAIEADKVLQSYFNSRKGQHPAMDEGDETEDLEKANDTPQIVEDEDEDGLPFLIFRKHTTEWLSL